MAPATHCRKQGKPPESFRRQRQPQRSVRPGPTGGKYGPSAESAVPAAKKLPADKKGGIESALARLKDAHKNQDLAGIDAATNDLNAAFQAASQDMYNAQNAQAGGQQAGPQDFGGQQPGGDSQQGDVTDVDFEEVK